MNERCVRRGTHRASGPCKNLILLASRRVSGPCAALVWSDDPSLYRCGLIAQPAVHLPRALAWAGPLLARLARRYIAAGVGCDCNLAVEPLTP